ncbi:26S proteasome regulatory subunit rpn6 like protein [Verticillium longisporum]|uniref:26S proteasome regulatory subunit rpn6 like protein n=1 Tax=Verticillium longisporum TaxID=100787 RepID=A0A8I2Z155_VERLO|nr:26S proteasome regulatory subunit rpn6 like protein [Verticillium longisporum]
MAQGDSARVQEAQKLAKSNPREAEQAYQEILSKPPSATSDAAIKEYEAALISLGELYRDEKNAQSLVDLVTTSRTTLSSFAKAKTAKLVRQLLDLFDAIPNTTDTQIAVTKTSRPANLDMQSGMLHAEDKDFNTAFSYFIEALDGYHTQDEPVKATAALQYMLLCKIMLNLADDVNNLMASKQAQKYAGQNLEAMKAIARAHSNRSLEEYERALTSYRYELGSDAFIRNHLRRLYDAMLEQNLIKVIEPFSRVEIDHIAKMVGLDTQQVERKLSQMILDKVIIGVLDQGAGCLIIFDETHRDESYDHALATIEKLGGVVDVLYTNQASQLE